MSENIGTSRKYRRDQKREEPPPEEENQLFWDKLNQDESYNGYKYDATIFADSDFTESELERNKSWLHASEVVYDMEHDETWASKVARLGWSEAKAKAEIDEWGLGYMGRFNYNLPIMASQAIQLKSDETPQEERLAFKYMMDAYDHKSWSGYGFGRALAGMSYDPSSYIGLGTAAVIAKVTLVAPLKTAIFTGVGAMGVEGAVYAYADDDNRQDVDIAAGAKDEKDYGQATKSAAFGFAFGMALGKGVAVVAKNGRQWAKNTGEFVVNHKMVTASAAAAMPATAMAAGGYSEYKKEENLEQASENLKDGAAQYFAEQLESKFGNSPNDSSARPPISTSSDFNEGASLPSAPNHSAASPYTSANNSQLAREFNLLMHSLKTGADHEMGTITLNLSSDPAPQATATIH